MKKDEKKACNQFRFCHYIVMTIKEYMIRKSFEPKTFSDLIFNDHPNSSNGVIARLDLGNNLEISVVAVKSGPTGFGTHYGSLEDKTYEVAVFHNNNMLPLSPFDQVRGWQTEDELTELMGELQGKPEDIHSFIEQLHVAQDEWKKEIA